MPVFRLKFICWVMLFVFMGNFLSACGGGAGTSNSTPVSVSLETTGPFSEQQVVSAKVTNYTLTADTYQATIDGKTSITIARSSSNTFGWLMPSLADGNHTIEITLNNQKIPLQFTTKQVRLTQDANTTISGLIADLKTTIDSSLSSLNAQTGNDSEIAFLTKLKNDIISVEAQLPSLSNEEKNSLALFIELNLSSLAPQAKWVAKSTAKSVFAHKARLVAAIAGFAVSGLAITTPVGIIGAAASTLFFIIEYRELINHFDEPNTLVSEGLATAVDRLDEPNMKVLPKILASTLPQKTLTFFSWGSDAFEFRTEYTLTPTGISFFSEITGMIKSLRSELLAALPNDIKSWANSSFSNSSILSDGSTYSVQSTSNDNITGIVLPAQLGFLCFSFSFKTYETQPATPVPFTFTLVDSRDGHTSTIAAILKPRQIDHVSLTATSTVTPKFQPVALLAQIFEEADEAESFVLPSIITDYIYTVTSGSGTVDTSSGYPIFVPGNTYGPVTINAKHKASGLSGNLTILVLDDSP